jgi:hypothetical protein
MNSESKTNPERKIENVELPAPTAWPFVLAFGITLLFAGLLTSASVSLIGSVLSVIAAVGWFRDVLPREASQHVAALQEKPVIATLRPDVARVSVAPALLRAWVPLEIYPISAGMKGGLVGGVVMAVLAVLYGLLKENSVWYPINLLVAGFFPAFLGEPTARIAAFHLGALLIAIPLHLLTSLTVGLLYGATLPMLPRNPILLGGAVAPVAWSGLLYTTTGIINPVLNQRISISWPWFVVSQVGFGIVAGIIVSRHQRIPTWQRLPLVLRAGIEAPGTMQQKHEEYSQ